MADDDRNVRDPWMTLAEIAEELRVNPATVRQWVSKGQLTASRAGVRKWIVRRSELERMLAESNSPQRARELAAGPLAAVAPPACRRPGRSGASGREPSSASYGQRHRSLRNALTVMQSASTALEEALAASAHAPPSPGYTDRARAIAEACERYASTMFNAAQTSGISWQGASDEGTPRLPYELRRGGNRPERPDLWNEFDAAFEVLTFAMTGHDLLAVADGFREVGETLGAVADALEDEDETHALEL